MSLEPFTAVAAGAGLAVVSGAHCLVMCGPLAAATRTRGGAASFWQYACGRIAAYTLLGLMAGSVGDVLVQSPLARWAEAGLSWLLALSLLVTALGQLRTAPRSEPLIKLGTGPRRSLLRAALSRVADEPLLLGMVTALLPCGALYSALLAAAALGSPLAGALSMASFSALSSGALLLGAQLSRVAHVGAAGHKALGLVLLLGAAVMVLRPLPMITGAGKPSCHPQGAL